MSDSALAVVLQSDKLDIDEKEIVGCVREWATVNSVSLDYRNINILYIIYYHTCATVPPLLHLTITWSLTKTYYFRTTKSYYK